VALPPARSVTVGVCWRRRNTVVACARPDPPSLRRPHHQELAHVVGRPDPAFASLDPASIARARPDPPGLHRPHHQELAHTTRTPDSASAPPDLASIACARPDPPGLHRPHHRELAHAAVATVVERRGEGALPAPERMRETTAGRGGEGALA
jgi:hypothetical protein